VFAGKSIEKSLCWELLGRGNWFSEFRKIRMKHPQIFALHVRETDLGYSSFWYVLYQTFNIAQQRS